MSVQHIAFYVFLLVIVLSFMCKLTLTRFTKTIVDTSLLFKTFHNMLLNVANYKQYANKQINEQITTNMTGSP